MFSFVIAVLQSISSSSCLILGKVHETCESLTSPSNLSIRSHPSPDDPPVFLHSTLPPSPLLSRGDRATTGETAFFPSHHPLHLALPDSRLALVLNAYRMLYSPTNTVLVYLWGCEIRRKIDLTYLGQFQGNSALSKRAQVEVEPGTKATEWRRRSGVVTTKVG